MPPFVEAPTPIRLRFTDAAKTTLAVDWPDGHVSTYPLSFLRGWCPCAGCQSHAAVHSWTPHAAARLTAILPVGNYAFSFTWDDGHSTGIYTFEWLRRWCPCPACGGMREGTPPEVAGSQPADDGMPPAPERAS